MTTASPKTVQATPSAAVAHIAASPRPNIGLVPPGTMGATLQQQVNASPYMQGLQRKVNQQTGRALQMEPDDEAATATNEDTNELLGVENETSTKKEVTAYRSPIKLGPNTHHVEMREVNGEYKIGVATTWTEINNIHTRVRAAAHPLNAAVTNAMASIRTLDLQLRDVRKRLNDNGRIKKRIKDKYRKGKRSSSRVLLSNTHMTIKDTRNLKKAEHTSVLLNVELDEVYKEWASSVNTYIKKCYEYHGAILGPILGDLLPTSAMNPPNNLVVPANARRYHEGTQADPIPIIWYKPLNQYPALNLPQAKNNLGQVAAQNIAYPGNFNVVYYSGPENGNVLTPYNFMVAQNNRVAGKNLGNAFDIRNTRGGNSRVNQQRFNKIITGMGHNMAGQDGDHVKDLGFQGLDQINNFWPLPSAVNQRALSWRKSYRIYFKELDNGTWTLKSAAINGLPNKYFRIKGEENVNVPAESATNNAGNGLGYGNARNINVNGTMVQEA